MRSSVNFSIGIIWKRGLADIFKISASLKNKHINAFRHNATNKQMGWIYFDALIARMEYIHAIWKAELFRHFQPFKMFESGKNVHKNNKAKSRRYSKIKNHELKAFHPFQNWAWKYLLFISCTKNFVLSFFHFKATTDSKEFKFSKEQKA